MAEIKEQQTIFKCNHCGKVFNEKLKHKCSGATFSFTEYELGSEIKPIHKFTERGISYEEAVAFNQINKFIEKLKEVRKEYENLPKYKKGDLVRYEDDVFCIESVEFLFDKYVYRISGIKYLVGEQYIEPYYPKQGEFYACETQGSNIHIRNCKQICDDRIYADFSIGGSGLLLDYGYILNSDVLSYRPLSEQEKQQLIKAVEDKYNKTWNGKKWVDMINIDKKAEKLKEILEYLKENYNGTNIEQRVSFDGFSPVFKRDYTIKFWEYEKAK